MCLDDGEAAFISDDEKTLIRWLWG